MPPGPLPPASALCEPSFLLHGLFRHLPSATHCMPERQMPIRRMANPPWTKARSATLHPLAGNSFFCLAGQIVRTGVTVVNRPSGQVARSESCTHLGAGTGRRLLLVICRRSGRFRHFRPSESQYASAHASGASLLAKPRIPAAAQVPPHALPNQSAACLRLRRKIRHLYRACASGTPLQSLPAAPPNRSLCKASGCTICLAPHRPAPSRQFPAPARTARSAECHTDTAPLCSSSFLLNLLFIAGADQ